LAPVSHGDDVQDARPKDAASLLLQWAGEAAPYIMATRGADDTAKPDEPAPAPQPALPVPQPLPPYPEPQPEPEPRPSMCGTETEGYERTAERTLREEALERGQKLVFFERVFFELDEDASLFIDKDECEMLLSFTALDLDPAERGSVLSKYDFNGDGRLNRVEFCMLCEGHLWDVPILTIERAVQNMKAVTKAVARRNNTYWKKVADDVDNWSRVVVPFMYFFALIAVFNLDLSDEYNTNPNGAMFSGIPNRAKLSTSGSIYLTVYLAVAASFTAAWALMKRVAERTKRMEAQSIKEAARMAATRARSATAETENASRLEGESSSG